MYKNIFTYQNNKSIQYKWVIVTIGVSIIQHTLLIFVHLENQLDSDNEEKEAQKKKEEEEAKKKAFGDEDAVDTEKIRKEKLEEQKKADREA